MITLAAYMAVHISHFTSSDLFSTDLISCKLDAL